MVFLDRTFHLVQRFPSQEAVWWSRFGDINMLLKKWFYSYGILIGNGKIPHMSHIYVYIYIVWYIYSVRYPHTYIYICKYIYYVISTYIYTHTHQFMVHVFLALHGGEKSPVRLPGHWQHDEFDSHESHWNDAISAAAVGNVGAFHRKNGAIPMENHHFSWGNPLFLWWFSIAILT